MHSKQRTKSYELKKEGIAKAKAIRLRYITMRIP